MVTRIPDRCGMRDPRCGMRDEGRGGTFALFPISRSPFPIRNAGSAYKNGARFTFRTSYGKVNPAPFIPVRRLVNVVEPRVTTHPFAVEKPPDSWNVALTFTLRLITLMMPLGRRKGNTPAVSGFGGHFRAVQGSAVLLLPRADPARRCKWRPQLAIAQTPLWKKPRASSCGSIQKQSKRLSFSALQRRNTGDT